MPIRRDEVPLGVEVLGDGPVTVLRLTGVADYESATVLRAILTELVAQGDPVVVDVTALRLLDAYSLGLLLVARRRITLTLAGASGIVLRVLELTATDKAFGPDPHLPPPRSAADRPTTTDG
jgi:anti-anti-sigma factor